VRSLLDPARRSSKIGQLAAFGMYGDEAPGAGIITESPHRPGANARSSPTTRRVKAHVFPMTVKKHLRMQEIAAQKPAAVHLPGRFRRRQPAEPGTKCLPDREHFGRNFLQPGKPSAAGIPQIACVMGSCTAGGAYVPAMSDESIIVKGQGTIFLGGPPIGEGGHREIVSAEDLGAPKCIRASPACRTTMR